MNYDFLKASNGSGDAALMHVQTLRLAGSATIDVDTIVNVPTKFIGTWGTLLSNGLIDGATKRDFRGHVSGSDLVIDAMEPGSTDGGNTVGQVVVVKPTTGWTNRVAGFIMNAKNLGTPEALYVSDLTAGNITASTYSINNSAYLDGQSNATFRYTLQAADFTNTYKRVAFPHGLGYTPDVEARFTQSTVSTTFDQLPWLLITGSKSYFGIPQDATITVAYTDATNIYVDIAIHSDDGATILAAISTLYFQFFCRPFPGTVT
jgi:hypothetical protein